MKLKFDEKCPRSSTSTKDTKSYHKIVSNYLQYVVISRMITSVGSLLNIVIQSFRANEEFI